MSEPGGPGSDAASANGQLPHGPGRDQDAPAEAEAEAAPDPWFAPVTSGDATARPGVEVSDDTGWFLRTGRAGLRPDSMTESWEESGPGPERLRTTSAPPWAGDQSAGATGAPPPWESGPWPGPGGEAPRPGGPGGTAPASPAAADTGNWQATAAAGASILPLVLPGLALGILGLRRARVTRTGRAASWLAIAISVAWAVVLIVWLASSGGTTASACGGYQSAVSIQVSQVLRDLSSNAPQNVLTADLRQAISQANNAAAQAQQVTARDAMATLTARLQQVAADGSAADSLRHQEVAAAAAELASACKA
jgi:hypothetical protein